MEYSLVIIFWYGLIHAISPDHLIIIANFSIGKSKLKTFLISLMFAIGHGVAIFLFAKILLLIDIDDSILSYGDTISSIVILSMGFYLLYMSMTNQIQLKTHKHKDKNHIHIWFGKSHEHENKSEKGAFGIGLLMGIGGIRGMLITMGVINDGDVGLSIIVMFMLGVSVVFLAFGLLMLFINENFLKTKSSIKKVVATAGIISVAVGLNVLIPNG